MLADLSDAFSKAITEELESKRQFLGAGKAESYERYKELAGEIAGLKQALGIFNNVAKRHGELEDEQ